MAGSITVSSITLDSDNNFSIKSNTGATLFFANTTGIDIANSIGATAITSDKILSVANTKISGNIASSQIAPNQTLYGNVSVTGTLSATGAITGSSTVAGSTGILYPLTSGTAVTLTTQTSVDFTSIPSWVKRITVMFNGVSTNGTSVILIQLGDSGGIETSGYTGGGNYLPGAGTVTLSTTGFGLMGLNPTASTFHDGFITLALQNSGTFTWVETGLLIRSDANMTNTAGAKSLSATLDRIRITTVNGTDTFDAGSINILFE